MSKGLLSVLCLLICGVCIGSPHQIPYENNTLISSPFTVSIHHFAQHLYGVIASTAAKSSNMVISPFSVYISLAMAAMGAGGATLEQIERALNLNMNDTQWQQSMKKLFEDNGTLKTPAEALKPPVFPAAERKRSSYRNAKSVLKMANSIWTSKDIHIKLEYLDSILEIFNTEALQIDYFQNLDAVCQLINNHVDQATHGHIRDLLPDGSLSEDTKMILVNALYFKGSWLNLFDTMNTRVKPFFIDEKFSVNVSMMHITDDFRVGTFDDLDAAAILLPYQDNRHGLLCVLPNKKSGLKEIENRLFINGYTPAKLLSKMNLHNVALALPKFKIRFNSKLSDFLRKMGVVDLFEDGVADLSGISSFCPLKVSQIYHQSMIEVSENGTEAAAATALVAARWTSGCFRFQEPIEFKADHPFLFHLVDLEKDAIPLFVGRLNNPLALF